MANVSRIVFLFTVLSGVLNRSDAQFSFRFGTLGKFWSSTFFKKLQLKCLIHLVPTTPASTSDQVISSDVANGRSISSGSIIQTNSAPNDKAQEKPIASIKFGIKDVNSLNEVNTKPISFVIPSYASGIISENITTHREAVIPSLDLLPPIANNSINASVVNTITRILEQELLPPLFDKAPGSNGFEASQETTALPTTESSETSTPQQTTLLIGTQKYTSTTPFQLKSTTTALPTIKPTEQQITTKSTLPTTKPVHTFEKTTSLPPLFNQQRNQILGFQLPGFAIRPDGSIDSNATPFRHASHEKPKAFAFTTPLATTYQTTTNEIPTQPITTSSNYSNNPWLQNTPSNAGQYTISKSNPFLTGRILPNDRSSTPATTTVNAIVNFVKSTPKPLNTQRTRHNQNTTNLISEQKAANTSRSVNSINNNAINYSPSIQADNKSPKDPLNKGVFAIHVPDSILLPPLPVANDSTFTPASAIKPLEPILTTIPTTANPTTAIPTTALPTTFQTKIPSTTAATTLPPTSSSLDLNVLLPSQDLLPPVVSTNASSKTPTPLASRNDFGLANNASKAGNQTEGNLFLPQLDLNPFLPPILAAPHSVATSLNTTQISTASLPAGNVNTRISNTVNVQRQSFGFVSRSQVNVHSAVAQQHSYVNNKYTGNFGAPPGILTPYDNINRG